MPGLRDILDAAPPGPWDIPATSCWFWGKKEDRHAPIEVFEAQSKIIALAPELAALCLDMGEALATHRDWVSVNSDSISRDIYMDAELLLARLSRLGAGDSNQNEKEQT